ncbi:hypothetical protein THMIRHAS_16120 [Thiosulfatimonas sediminis]|uniref:NlpC/P60 domain-containing protein n=1 Tax=Thiosulfatimonas sediminis TaxID=2675054 RepID=A0A6F8PVU8_9GAMM|nr:hypothetical protein THMIRHAS_16120 [Thiosulfatimonas sediminis]
MYLTVLSVGWFGLVVGCSSGKFAAPQAESGLHVLQPAQPQSPSPSSTELPLRSSAEVGLGQSPVDVTISDQAWRELDALVLGVSQSASTNFVQKSSPAQHVSDTVYGRLMRYFDDWQGTPYRYGGNSKRGVDCSALVQIAYARQFQINLPRTTELQRRQGKPVKRSQLKAGDVLFFKTGWRTYHNGIYLGDSRFMHASSTKGVILSSLSEDYWQKRFLEARRLLN